MTDALHIVEDICKGKSGINLQTILKDKDEAAYEGQDVFDYQEKAKAHIHFDAQHVYVTLTFDEDAEFEGFLDALTKMSDWDEPEGGSLYNIITIVPEDPTDGVEYASAYLGLYLANDDDLTVQLIFARGDFGVFSLDTNSLEELADNDEDIDDHDEDYDEQYDDEHFYNHPNKQ